MRIVFMGTPEFSVPSLARLYGDGHDIAAVFTQPDKPKNRGHKLAYSPVKEYALGKHTPVYQPDSLKDGEVFDTLTALTPELIVVVAYGKLLPREILNLPPQGCVNIHGSLLPKYRGAAPVQHAVLNGECETGVTSMYMSEELDAGDIILTESTEIGADETSGEVLGRLSVLGAELLSKTADLIAAGEAAAKRTPQKHSDASYAPPLSKEDTQIDFKGSAFSAKCKVRGLNPWPVATTVLDGTLIKVFSAETGGEVGDYEAGEIVTADKRGIGIACSDRILYIKELQAPGGKRMAAADYLRGHPVKTV